MLKNKPSYHTAVINATYLQILTGAPNRVSREDKTYKPSKKKNQIRRVANSTLT
jgi:hypothetical protein